jgi:hypothetical protein
VVVQGLRFDLKVSAIGGFLLLLVLPWVSGVWQGRIAAGLAFVFVMLSLVNLHYFGFYKTPIDSLVFGLVEDDTAGRAANHLARLSGGLDAAAGGVV